MARRTLVLSFLILLGAVFAHHLFHRDEPSPLRDTNSNREDTATTAKTKDESVKVAPAQAQAREAASSARLIEESRAQVDPKFIRGDKKIETSGAHLERTSLFEGTPWKLWTGTSAIPKHLGKPSVKVLGEVNGYYVVEDLSPADFRNFSSDRPLVVVDTRLDKAGVVTGVFSVILKEGFSPEVLMQNGVRIVASFDNIRTYYVTSLHEPFDLLSFQDSLKRESAVENVNMEILDRQYEKN